MSRSVPCLVLAAALAAACHASPDAPLAAATARNDAAEVRRLLAAGHTADETDGSGVTALMWGARTSAVEAMAVLLGAGADPNRRDARNRWTPLLHAIHKQRRGSVRLLLDRGADPGRATPGGVTPLMMAADDPDPTIVTLLLEHGADPRVEGPGGVTALTQAVSGGALSDVTDRPLFGGCHPATVRAFLMHNQSLTMPDTMAGRHALWWARLHDCTDVLQLIGKSRSPGPAHQAISGVGMLREEVAAIVSPRKADAQHGTR